MNHLIRKFVREEHGGFSIEYVIWFPLFVVIIALTIDISITFNNVSRMWDVARDTARRVTTEEMTTAEAKTYAKGLFSGYGTYTVSIDDSTDNVFVVITSSDTSPVIGIYDYIAPQAMRVLFTMRKDVSTSDLGGDGTLKKEELFQAPSS